MTSIQSFIKDYTQAISEGYAAIFAGAGLSRGSGYINWKELVKPFADEIGLDVEKEHDIIALTQYYCNERGGRASVNQRIINEFTKDAAENTNIDILTRLSIDTYWTTNYDELIENGLKKNNRKADVKITQASLAQNIYDRDAVVYKMHGDIKDVANTVITKDDYEKYQNERPLFRTALTGDLISKTFLFIGFSFDDPNLTFILSQINILLGESKRDHYCFFESVNRDRFDEEEEYIYAKAKQELAIRDLRRYGIQAVLLSNYGDITGILEQVEKYCKLKNIFISGSLEKAEGTWTNDSAERFSFDLSKELVKENNRVISGFGLGIGSSVINGALEEIFENKYKHIDEHLCLRPFPQIARGSKSIAALWNEYRHEIIEHSGICIFIFGNKLAKGSSEIIVADGMIEEFEIAKKMNKVIIPIGNTGGAAKQIFDEMVSDIKGYPHLEEYMDKLSNFDGDASSLVNLCLGIIRKIQNY